MHPKSVRVVYENMPYLLTLRDDDSVDHAHGPFTPGTEPSLAMCDDDNEVRDPALRGTLERLARVSPTLPADDDTLAGG
jgi:hypothetical protein